MCVYIGNPNPTRHLDNHHSKIEEFERKLYTLRFVHPGREPLKCHGIILQTNVTGQAYVLNAWDSLAQ